MKSYLEEGGIEDGGDGAGAPVHHPQHLPGLPGVVPPHTQAVQVVEQAQPHLLRCELLYP